jgi:glycosyltransferase involved in cell wall biosynthesis
MKKGEREARNAGVHGLGHEENRSRDGCGLLFITWDGPGSDYLRSLFLPTLTRLGLDLHVLQLSWDTPDRIDANRTACETAGASYSHVRIRRFRPLGVATLASVALGRPRLIRILHRSRPSWVMPRSTLPALLVRSVASQLRQSGAKLAFDADGLMQDERVEFGGWDPSGANYRVLREVEAQTVRAADTVITRTERAKRILLARAGPSVTPDKIHVIPNAKDEHAFQPVSPSERASVRESLQVPSDSLLLVYCGSVGDQYHPRETLEFFQRVRTLRSDARMLLLTGHEERAQTEARAAGLDSDSLIIRRVPADEVPRYLGAADVAVAFRTPSFSQQAVSPIKIGEFLLCGLPIVTNTGVGDLDKQLGGFPGAHVVNGLDSRTLQAAAEWAVSVDLGAVRAPCRSRGLEHYSLETALRKYRISLGLEGNEGASD